MFFSFPASEILLLVSTFFTWMYLMIGFAGNVNNKIETNSHSEITTICASIPETGMYLSHTCFWKQKDIKYLVSKVPDKPLFVLSLGIKPILKNISVFPALATKEFLKRAPPIF